MTTIAYTDAPNTVRAVDEASWIVVRSSSRAKSASLTPSELALLASDSDAPIAHFTPSKPRPAFD